MPLPTNLHSADLRDRALSDDASRADAEQRSTDRLAIELERRGLAAPAALLLDAHRPLVPLIRQASIFLGPFLAPVAGSAVLRAMRSAIDRPDLYDALTRRLRSGKD